MWGAVDLYAEFIRSKEKKRPSEIKTKIADTAGHTAADITRGRGLLAEGLFVFLN